MQQLVNMLLVSVYAGMIALFSSHEEPSNCAAKQSTSLDLLTPETPSLTLSVTNDRVDNPDERDGSRGVNEIFHEKSRKGNGKWEKIGARTANRSKAAMVYRSGEQLSQC